MTWNATGIMSSCTYLCNALSAQEVDICGISEHWLFEHDLQFLNSIDNMYYSHAVSDFSLTLPSNRRVGKGGVCLLWKRTLNDIIIPLDVDDDRIIGIEVKTSPSTLLYIFQVYIPCVNHGNNVFKRYMEKVENLFYSYSQKGMVIVMGDFNAELNIRNQRNAYFAESLRRNNILSVNGTMLNSTYTNISYNGGVGSLIDHILLASEKFDLIVDCYIPDDNALNVSSHYPVFCTVRLPNFNCNNHNKSERMARINWSKITREQINDYQLYLHTNIQHSNILNQDVVCISQIDNMYDFIITLINNANKECFPRSKFKHFLKPYWDIELKSVCKISKIKRRLWILDGKPRGNEHKSYTEYKGAKRELRKIHRRKVSQYLSKQLDDIDKYADIDSTLFWKCINRRRKPSRTAAGNELVFHNKVYREPQSINEQWAQYFEDLYTPTENATFKEDFKIKTLAELETINEYVSSQTVNDNVTSVSMYEVQQACTKAKRNKASGPDGCFYENFKLGGDVLYRLCAKFFSAMLKFSYCPTDMKKGDIIVLHKGGNKTYNDPNNYRAITLSSVLLKLYETIILARMKQVCSSVNDLQGGFREGMGCIMTSFLFRECSNYVTENGSKLYSCFLDVRQAFDRVWHEALMVKLFNSNIQVYLYKTIFNMYQNMQSRVISNGYASSWFPILQGVRQGGVISPHLYLIFINDLMNQLCNSQHGLTVYDLNCTCPSSADDMVLLSLSKSGLQELMNICYEYSTTHRYTYNAKKSAVIVADRKSARSHSTNRRWLLGNDGVCENDSYTHLGVLFHKDIDLSQVVKECSSKLRKTFLSILNCGIYENGIHPLSAKHLYEAIVLPKALYGCEMWSELTSDEIQTLEIAHRFCLKVIQSLPKSSRTDIVLSSIGILPIEAEIDKRKLLFFGQLCRLDNDTTVKKLFIHRLCDYKNHSSRVRGFIPDICRIINKYDLNDILNAYCNAGVSPTKATWKRIVSGNIKLNQLSSLRSRIMSDSSLCDYLLIQALTEVSPCHFWLLSKSNRGMLKFSQAGVKLTHLLFSKPYIQECKKCRKFMDNIALHLSFYCERTANARATLWENVYRYCGHDAFTKLISCPPKLQLIHILSGLHHLMSSDLDPHLLREIGSFLFKILK